MEKRNVKDLIFGFVVGDALGVPVEFAERDYLTKRPVTTMIDGGIHLQKPGTWSDDSSMTFCLMESMIEGYNILDLSLRFQNWMYQNYWAPHGENFDIGITTSCAIQNLLYGADPSKSGLSTENSKGNGSLMRISPIIFYSKNLDIADRYDLIKELTIITHNTDLCIDCGFFYTEFILNLIETKDKFNAFHLTKFNTEKFLIDKDKFKRIFDNSFTNLSKDEIKSSGYVLDTLEASLWTFLNYDSYSDIVLNAVNLGDDTDTVAALAGGLAGIFYGYEFISNDWINSLADLDKINDLILRFENKFF